MANERSPYERFVALARGVDARLARRPLDVTWAIRVLKEFPFEEWNGEGPSPAYRVAAAEVIWRTRELAAQALATVDQLDSREALASVLDSPHPPVASRALWALAGWGDVRAVPGLLAACQRPGGAAGAAHLLTRFLDGQAGRVSTEALRSLAGVPDAVGWVEGPPDWCGDSQGHEERIDCSRLRALARAELARRESRDPGALPPAEASPPAAASLLATFRAHANAERAAFTAGYFPTAMEIVGLSTPDMRALLAPARKLPPEELLTLARALIASGVHEGRQAGYDLLDRSRKARALLDGEAIEALGMGNDNWASVDAFACGVAGRCWNEGVLEDARVLRWAMSPDRWWRRTALVCTVPLNMKSRGGRGDPARTWAVCDRLASDSDDMVAKALSWALRELLPYDEAGVVAFLARPGVPARVRREVQTRLRTGTRSGRSAAVKPQ